MGKKIAAQFDGKCKINEQHTWKKNEEIYWDKAHGATCSDEACFKAQGGVLDEKPTFKVTPEMRANWCRDFQKDVFPMVEQLVDNKFAEAAIKPTFQEKWISIQALTKAFAIVYAGGRG